MRRLILAFLLLVTVGVNVPVLASYITLTYNIRTQSGTIPSPAPPAYVSISVDGSADPSHQMAPVLGTWYATSVVGPPSHSAGSYEWLVPANSYIRLTCSYTNVNVYYQCSTSDVLLNTAIPSPVIPPPTWASLLVPYTGATGNVDLGNYKLLANWAQLDALTAAPTFQAGGMCYVGGAVDKWYLATSTGWQEVPLSGVFPTSITPLTTNTYDVGGNSNQWRYGYFNRLELKHGGGGNNAYIKMYNDSIVETIELDGLTGNITTSGTVDGVDVSTISSTYLPFAGGTLVGDLLFSVDADYVSMGAPATGRGHLFMGHQDAAGNPVCSWTYNLKPGFTRETADIGLGFFVEGHYAAGPGDDRAECYFQYSVADGFANYSRPFMCTYDKATNLVRYASLTGGVTYGLALCIHDGLGSGEELIIGKQRFLVGYTVNTSKVDLTVDDGYEFRAQRVYVEGDPSPTAGATYGGHIFVESGQTDAATNGVEWGASTAGSGFGFRAATVYDGAANIDWKLQSRQGAHAWTDALMLDGATSALTALGGFIGSLTGTASNADQLDSHDSTYFSISGHTHAPTDLTGWPANASGVLKNNGTGTLSWGSGASPEKTYSLGGVLFVITGALRWYPPASIHLVSVTAAVNTAPIGADIKVDINKNGATILGGSTLDISAGANLSTVTANTTALASTDYLQVDVDQVGSTEPGRDLTLRILYTVD